MTNFSFWQRWLFIVSIVVSIFGVLMVLFSGSSLFDLFSRQIDPAFWGTNPVGSAAREFQHWLYGILGATIAGWGVILAYVARYPFIKREIWARNGLVFGLVVWFILDTSLSLFYKVYFNAFFNTALLILVGLPVLVTRKEFS